MLRRSRTPQGDAERPEPFTYVHRGTTVVGELEAEGRVRVHGTVRGNLRVRGVLEIAEAGVVEGDRVEADEVKILGRVVAAVHAHGKVEIWKGGELVGDVRAAALDIEDGARFTGRSEMTEGTAGTSTAAGGATRVAAAPAGTPGEGARSDTTATVPPIGRPGRGAHARPSPEAPDAEREGAEAGANHRTAEGPAGGVDAGPVGG